MPNVGGHHAVVFSPLNGQSETPKEEAPETDFLDAYFIAVNDAETYLKTLRRLPKSQNRQGDLLFARSAWKRSGENLAGLILEEDTKNRSERQ